MNRHSARYPQEVFYFLYRVECLDGDFHNGNALAAGALFAALMEVAKHVFTWYLANYNRYNIIYGPLETLVIMVIWVFYVSSILLFCAELVSSYRRRTLLLSWVLREMK